MNTNPPPHPHANAQVSHPPMTSSPSTNTYPTLDKIMSSLLQLKEDFLTIKEDIHTIKELLITPPRHTPLTNTRPLKWLPTCSVDASKLHPSHRTAIHAHNRNNRTRRPHWKAIPADNRNNHPRRTCTPLSDLDILNLLRSYDPAPLNDTTATHLPIPTIHSKFRRPHPLNNIISVLNNLREVPLSLVPSTSPDTPRLKCTLLNCRSAPRHSSAIADLILSLDLDLIILTETWLTESSTPIMDILVPPNYHIIRLDRSGKIGGGIACIYRNNLSVLKVSAPSLPSPTSCEYICLDIISEGKPICSLHGIYHPPRDNLTFAQQIMDMISTNAGRQLTQIYLGDFNLHWNDRNDAVVNSLKNFLKALDLTQVCNSPTHEKGSILDLIIAKEDAILLESIQPCDWSDHHIVTFFINEKIKLNTTQSSRPKIWKRDLKKLNPDSLPPNSRDLLLPPTGATDVQSLTDHYLNAMTSIINEAAPMQLKRVSAKISNPWYDGSLNEDRRAMRMAERTWRTAPSALHLKRLKKKRNAYFRKIKRSKANFFSLQLDQAKNRPRKLFELIRTQAKEQPQPISSFDKAPSCEDFAAFFTHKTDNIKITPLLKKPSADPSDLNNYRPITNIPTLAKLLEKCAQLQLTKHIDQFDLLNAHQSGFRAGHSTESAMTPHN
ncbi:uncharacterized protein LOC144769684 [Lissotriton helveticus]